MLRGVGGHATMVFLKRKGESPDFFFFLNWVISEILEFQSQKEVLKPRTQLSTQRPGRKVNGPPTSIQIV